LSIKEGTEEHLEEEKNRGEKVKGRKKKTLAKGQVT
jgi:hypothetical protein